MRRHELIFQLELHRAECEFLSGAPADAEQRLEALSARATGAVEQATVASLRVDLYTALGRSDRAVGVCLDHLRHLGIDWSPHPTEEEVRREYERIWSQLESREIERLIDLPLMSDPASLATLDVLTKIVPPRCLPIRICFPWSSVEPPTSASNAEIAMAHASPMYGLAS